MFLAPLPEKTSSSSSSSAAAAVAATSAAAAVSGAILPRLISRWVDGIVVSARRVGVVFVPLLPTTFATSSTVTVGDDSADTTGAVVDAAAGLVAESVGLVGPASAPGGRALGHGGASPPGMKPVSQAPVGQGGNVVSQQVRPRCHRSSKMGGLYP